VYILLHFIDDAVTKLRSGNTVCEVSSEWYSLSVSMAIQLMVFLFVSY